MALGLGDEVWGEPMGRPGRPSRQYSAGRVCAQDGCGTVLSVYNRSDRCALHSWEQVGTGVDRRPGSRARREARAGRGTGRAAVPAA